MPRSPWQEPPYAALSVAPAARIGARVSDGPASLPRDPLSAKKFTLASRGRRRYAGDVRRNATLITLILSELGIAALALFFHLRSRPVVLQAFREFNTALPPTTALALTPWFLPSALVAAALCTAIALVFPFRRSRRPLVAGAGLVVLAFALIFAVWATFLPLFQPA